VSHHKTGSDKMDWATPQPLFDRLDAEFGFTLDACATCWTAKCQAYFTPEDDALSREWHGRVFMNPPYGRAIERWVRKAYEESQVRCEVVVGLIPVRSDARWWHGWVMKASEIRFTVGRVGYLDPSNGVRGRANITFGSAIVVWDSRRSGDQTQVSSFLLPNGSGRAA
jgi:phage N-6-adenine-methyltransferase